MVYNLFMAVHGYTILTQPIPIAITCKCTCTLCVNMHACMQYCAPGNERPKLKDLHKHVTPCYAAYWEDIGVYLDIQIGHLQVIKKIIQEIPVVVVRICGKDGYK